MRARSESNPSSMIICFFVCDTARHECASRYQKWQSSPFCIIAQPRLLSPSLLPVFFTQCASSVCSSTFSILSCHTRYLRAVPSLLLHYTTQIPKIYCRERTSPSRPADGSLLYGMDGVVSNFFVVVGTSCSRNTLLVKKMDRCDVGF